MQKFAVEMRDRRESPVTPWSRAQLVLVVLALMAVTAGIIVACVCGIRGCPAKHADTSQVHGRDAQACKPCASPALSALAALRSLPPVQESTQPLRLVLLFRDVTIDAADLVPAVLRPYVARLKLDSSLLQVSEWAVSHKPRAPGGRPPSWP